MRASWFVLLLPACAAEHAVTPNGLGDACARYLGCLEAADAASYLDVVDRVGGGSDCWADFDAAATCEAWCDEQFEVAASTPWGRYPECWRDGAPDLRDIFPEGTRWSWHAVGDFCNVSTGRADGPLVGTDASTFQMTLQWNSGTPTDHPCRLSTLVDFDCEDPNAQFDGMTGAFSGHYQRASLVIVNPWGTCTLEGGS